MTEGKQTQDKNLLNMQAATSRDRRQNHNTLQHIVETFWHNQYSNAS